MNSVCGHLNFSEAGICLLINYKAITILANIAPLGVRDSALDNGHGDKPGKSVEHVGCYFTSTHKSEKSIRNIPIVGSREKKILQMAASNI